MYGNTEYVQGRSLTEHRLLRLCRSWQCVGYDGIVGYCATTGLWGHLNLNQPKRYCLFSENYLSLLTYIAVGKPDDKICNNDLLHTKLAWPRHINVGIPMIYLDPLYVSLLMRKLHIKCCPAINHLILVGYNIAVTRTLWFNDRY